jgi:hypothetical protein
MQHPQTFAPSPQLITREEHREDLNREIAQMKELMTAHFATTNAKLDELVRRLDRRGQTTVTTISAVIAAVGIIVKALFDWLH